MGDVLDFPNRNRFCIRCGSEFTLANRRGIVNDDILYCRKCRRARRLSAKHAQLTKVQEDKQEKPSFGELLTWAKLEAVKSGGRWPTQTLLTTRS